MLRIWQWDSTRGQHEQYRYCIRTCKPASKQRDDSSARVKRCSKRCKYGSCTCRVTRNWFENSRRRCEICCSCKYDRRGFADCHEYIKYLSK
ncbi:hypothetical protein LSAT2_003945 [Lamellibrachia satsuma]|nr:hypothetical protein LSAT2_003945 [Lamellibrachia satsuma]